MCFLQDSGVDSRSLPSKNDTRSFREKNNALEIVTPPPKKTSDLAIRTKEKGEINESMNTHPAVFFGSCDTFEQKDLRTRHGAFPWSLWRL